MSSLYVTADQIGAETGGGKVTFHESEALRSLGPCEVWGWKDFDCLQGVQWPDPWRIDHWFSVQPSRKAKLAHFYAGTFTETVQRLKSYGAKVSYTAAAHDIGLSRREHEKLGVPFDYPHLTDPELWRGYVSGYLTADVVICPSQHSKRCMESYGCRNVTVIPHGVDLPKCKSCRGSYRGKGGWYEYDGGSGLPGPECQNYFVDCPDCDGTGVASIAPLPQRFVVGYLGAVGPDKGLIYLLQAWRKLNYQDGSELVLAGRQSKFDFVSHLMALAGFSVREPITVRREGWVESVSDFYNQISLYVQPSVTEGFGIEVLEAMAHGRPVLCSDGAGAADAVPERFRFPASDVDALAAKMDGFKRETTWQLPDGFWRTEAEKYTWGKIRQRYVDLWKRMLG